GPSLGELAILDRPNVHNPLHDLRVASQRNGVLASDDHHAIACGQQLLELDPNALELLEHPHVVLDHSVATTVDTGLRRTRRSVELNLGMEEWGNLGIARSPRIDSPTVESLVGPPHELHVLLRHRPGSISRPGAASRRSGPEPTGEGRSKPPVAS